MPSVAEMFAQIAKLDGLNFTSDASSESGFTQELEFAHKEIINPFSLPGDEAFQSKILRVVSIEIVRKINELDNIKPPEEYLKQLFKTVNELNVTWLQRIKQKYDPSMSIILSHIMWNTIATKTNLLQNCGLCAEEYIEEPQQGTASVEEILTKAGIIRTKLYKDIRELLITDQNDYAWFISKLTAIMANFVAQNSVLQQLEQSVRSKLQQIQDPKLYFEQLCEFSTQLNSHLSAALTIDGVANIKLPILNEFLLEKNAIDSKFFLIYSPYMSIVHFAAQAQKCIGFSAENSTWMKIKLKEQQADQLAKMKNESKFILGMQKDALKVVSDYIKLLEILYTKNRLKAYKNFAKAFELLANINTYCADESRHLLLENLHLEELAICFASKLDKFCGCDDTQVSMSQNSVLNLNDIYYVLIGHLLDTIDDMRLADGNMLNSNEKLQEIWEKFTYVQDIISTKYASAEDVSSALKLIKRLFHALVDSILNGPAPRDNLLKFYLELKSEWPRDDGSRFSGADKLAMQEFETYAISYLEGKYYQAYNIDITEKTYANTRAELQRRATKDSQSSPSSEGPDRKDTPRPGLF